MPVRLSSVFLLTSGGLWVWWLSALSSYATARDNAAKKCRDVLPWLRTVLYVLTSVLLLLLLCAGISIMAVAPGGAGEKGEALVLLGVIFAMTVLQLGYLQSVRFSDRAVADDCTQIARARRYTLLVIAAVFMLAGGIGVIDGDARRYAATLVHKKRGGARRR